MTFTTSSEYVLRIRVNWGWYSPTDRSLLISQEQLSVFTTVPAVPGPDPGVTGPDPGLAGAHTGGGARRFPGVQAALPGLPRPDPEVTGSFLRRVSPV